MPDTPQPPAPTPTSPRWDADTVFAMLADPARRRTLFAIARGGPQVATTLKSSAGKQLDATLKHLTALKNAGMVTTSPDPKDGRRTLYGLSPKMMAVRSADGTSLDFGCCVVRAET